MRIREALQEVFENCGGIFQTATSEGKTAKVFMEYIIIRIELDRLLNVVKTAIDLPKTNIDSAHVEVSQGMTRVGLQSFPVDPDRRFEPSLVTCEIGIVE